MLPLQLAIMKGMSLEVVLLLLEANPKATTSKDKARPPYMRPMRPLRPVALRAPRPPRSID